MYDYMDDWLTNGNNSENRGTSWGQYKSRLEKGMGIDIGLTARETGFYETNYFYGGATATEQRASSTLSDTATSFIMSTSWARRPKPIGKALSRAGTTWAALTGPRKSMSSTRALLADV